MTTSDFICRILLVFILWGVLFLFGTFCWALITSLIATDITIIFGFLGILGSIVSFVGVPLKIFKTY